MSDNIKVMIAGIGGASLGTEICKSLCLKNEYEVFGCDVSPTAYGLYDQAFSKTYHISREDYVLNVLKACHDSGARFLVPGGEQPMVLLGNAVRKFESAGIRLLTNSAEVITLFSNKAATFLQLAESGISIPKTKEANSKNDIDYVGLPCVIKPATGSGGSAAVFFAVNVDEAMIYSDFIRRMGSQPVAQEYVSVQEGEFTIGVLSLPDKKIIGAIALQRAFDAKLSVAYRGRGGLVSSGYSQGYIDEYPEICRQAEKIAEVIGSCGPINVQGRVRDGILLPFEINPRFSASTYLRAMAGFNEVDILIKYFADGVVANRPSIQPGWYLRSLTEQYVPKEKIK